jgi:uncharacterized membrane protein
MRFNATIKRILKGFLLIIVPIVLVVIVFAKLTKIVQQQILPLESRLPGEKSLGFGLISIISILVIVLISYLGGALMESKRMHGYFAFLEKNVLVFIPGYFVMKSKFTETSTVKNDSGEVVLVGENDEWRFGIETGRHADGYCTIFFPFVPDGKSGEIKLVHASKLTTTDITITKLISILRHYGQGAPAVGKQILI